jgi:hypothetical protein
MNIILWSNNGNVGELAPSPEWKGTLSELAAHALEPGTEWITADTSALPDEYFRNAWRYQNGAAVIDIESAQEIQRDKWRLARAPLLAKLDIDFMRAVETHDTDEQDRIAGEKQALRDVTETVLPSDPAGIKSAWPEILGPRP